MFGKKKELKAAKEEIAELSRKLMKRETELEYVKTAHDDLTEQFNLLSMENKELTAKLKHIKEVNRNRQTKFRNKNKK